MARTYVVLMNPTADNVWEVEAGSPEQAIRLCGEQPGHFVAIPKRNLTEIRRRQEQPKPPPLTMERLDKSGIIPADERTVAFRPEPVTGNLPAGNVGSGVSNQP